MIQNSLRAVIRDFSLESIGEEDFQKQQAIKEKYSELIAIQSRFPENVIVVTFEDFQARLESGVYSLSNVEFHVITGTEKDPVFGERVTDGNMKELEEEYNYVGFETNGNRN